MGSPDRPRTRSQSDGPWVLGSSVSCVAAWPTLEASLAPAVSPWFAHASVACRAVGTLQPRRQTSPWRLPSCCRPRRGWRGRWFPLIVPWRGSSILCTDVPGLRPPWATLCRALSPSTTQDSGPRRLGGALSGPLMADGWTLGAGKAQPPENVDESRLLDGSSPCWLAIDVAGDVRDDTTACKEGMRVKHTDVGYSTVAHGLVCSQRSLSSVTRHSIPGQMFIQLSTVEYS